MTFSAVLLVGGKSERMGEDKATILFRDRPLWKIQLDLLRKLQPVELFVSARNDPPWRPPDVRFVRDEEPSRGPLSGIAATLSQITTDHLLALAIDMPLMTESYLRGLYEKVDGNRGVVPLIENRAEPLAAIYPRRADVDFAEALASNNYSLQPVVAKLVAAGKLQPVQASLEDQARFRNLNEPADLERS